MTKDKLVDMIPDEVVQIIKSDRKQQLCQDIYLLISVTEGIRIR